MYTSRGLPCAHVACTSSCSVSLRAQVRALTARKSDFLFWLTTHGACSLRLHVHAAHALARCLHTCGSQKVRRRAAGSTTNLRSVPTDTLSLACWTCMCTRVWSWRPRLSLHALMRGTYAPHSHVPSRGYVFFYMLAGFHEIGVWGGEIS